MLASNERLVAAMDEPVLKMFNTPMVGSLIGADTCVYTPGDSSPWSCRIADFGAL